MLDPASASGAPPLEIIDLGLRPYAEVWELQRSRHRALIDGQGGEVLFLCRHHPVITFGRSTAPESLLVSREKLSELGIELFEIERGGDATFHGPGQLVMYPIINLALRRRDVAWYMRGLEETVIRMMAEFNVQGTRITGKTGVWTTPGNNDIESSPRKIASLGVRLSRWCSLHGLSLNVLDCSGGFSLINPCGFNDIRVTSIEEELASQSCNQPKPAPGLSLIQDSLIRHFNDIFDLGRFAK
jgi:lipoyl(octanoyl) transferase